MPKMYRKTGRLSHFRMKKAILTGVMAGKCEKTSAMTVTAANRLLHAAVIVAPTGCRTTSANNSASRSMKQGKPFILLIQIELAHIKHEKKDATILYLWHN